MNILVLGGGKGQLSLIKKAKAMGHQVIVSDYYEDAPGKKFADFSTNTSTFDIEGNIQTAQKYGADAVITIGTDQPVYTAAAVNEALNLPNFLSLETAKAVTNKKNMKNIFQKNNIPSVKYKIIAEDFADEDLKKFSFPVVVKPLDSQGQRGVFKLNSIKEIRERFNEVLQFSREDEILVEEYYQSEEITLSGWVIDSKINILSITDRITHQNEEHIGICSAHVFPSKFLHKYYNDIKKISDKIVKSFSIKEGPVYFQLLIGEKGIRVNEIACRIGGAYEAYFIPYLTGIDILELMINLSLAEKKYSATLETYQKQFEKYDILKNNKWLSVQLFFAESAKIAEITAENELNSLPEVLWAGLNFNKGDIISEIENATERAGYFIVSAETKDKLQNKIKKVYDNLKIYNAKGENLVIREIGENF